MGCPLWEVGWVSPPSWVSDTLPFAQVTASPESLGPLLLERQLVGRVAALAAAPAP